MRRRRTPPPTRRRAASSSWARTTAGARASVTVPETISTVRLEGPDIPVDVRDEQSALDRRIDLEGAARQAHVRHDDLDVRSLGEPVRRAEGCRSEGHLVQPNPAMGEAPAAGLPDRWRHRHPMPCQRVPGSRM